MLSSDCPAFLVLTRRSSRSLSQARDSLQPNYGMVSFIHDLKRHFQGEIKIYAMSNISKEDWAVLSTKTPAVQRTVSEIHELPSHRVLVTTTTARDRCVLGLSLTES